MSKYIAGPFNSMYKIDDTYEYLITKDTKINNIPNE